MTKSEQPKSEQIWRIPLAVERVPDGGLHLEVCADAATRAAVAALAGVAGLTRLDATFDVVRWGGGGLRVTGEVRGTAGQTCVVTLEPIENEICEAFDATYAPPAAADPLAEVVVRPDDADPPEPLSDGTVDLGRLATEFLLLGVDPYPRKPGAVFAPPSAAEGDQGPFAALAALKKDHTTDG
jgi:hypothetical protein